MKYVESKEDYDYDASVENTPEKKPKLLYNRTKKPKGRKLKFDGTLLSGNTCNGNNSVYNNKKDDDSVRDVVVEPEFPTLILDLEQISTIVVEDFLENHFENFFEKRVAAANIVFADIQSKLEYRNNLYKELFESGKRRFFTLWEETKASLSATIRQLTKSEDITKKILGKIIIHNKTVANFASISDLYPQQEHKELSVVSAPVLPLRKPQPIRFNRRKNVKTTSEELIAVREKLQLLNI